ncbi:MAG: MotA/TolQ/ExbB proton channel family protein [Rhodomicrobium sp.]
MDNSLTQTLPAFSFATLILNADPVVQGVMLALAIASAICWAIAFEKIISFRLFSGQVRAAERFAGAHKATVANGSWLIARLTTLGQQELREFQESASDAQACVERALQMEIASQMRRLQSGLPILATVGSTAPFVGLFGTVWGIMNSFTAIAAAKDTSLAAVAPGIAEALLATAAGLAAAIPAVIFYNLANVYLSDRSERLAIAASKVAKSLVYGGLNAEALTVRQPADLETEMLLNGAIDAR